MSRMSSTDLTTRSELGAGLRTTRLGGPPRLVMLKGSEPGRRWSLEGPVRLGRADHCEVLIDDSKVSREHCEIVVDDEDWIIRDLHSRNGTLVNGELVTEHILAVGDRIQLSTESLFLFTRQDPLEDQLFHRQQMEVIGQLAAGIAHDFNNLLNVISASTSHLATLSPDTRLDEREVVECREDIAAAAKRAAELTARLLRVARRREHRGEGEGYRGVDLSQLCEDVVQLLRRTFDQTIKIDTHIEPGLTVHGDHSALHQALMNLCINARDAMPERGTLTVRAKKVAAGEEASAPSWGAGPQIALEVSDTGIGMDEATRARVFEPFFTTKAQGAGSGLGLATVYEVITTHGGSIEVSSSVGHGSSFRIRLTAKPIRPTAPGASRRVLGATLEAASERRSEGIVLVVDDQELVRRSLGRLLRADGHEIHYASDGAEAIEAYAKADPKPDVILLDLDMPNVSGAEALDRLKVMDPDVRVVLVSGYYDEERKRRLLGAGATAFLAKPVDAQELRDSVRLAMQLPTLGV